MKEPAVRALVYKASPGPYVAYEVPSPLTFVRPEFKGTLRSGELILELTPFRATEGEARALVEPFVRGWVISSGLATGAPLIEFEFQKAEYIDLNPAGRGPDKLIAVSRSGTISADSAIAFVAKKSYPPPPTDFLTDPDVSDMWLRYRSYKEGAEPLAGMAFFCLTLFTGLTGPVLKTSAKKANVSDKVLIKLSELTSIRGSKLTARKVSAQFTGQEFSKKEIEWVEKAVRLLIQRLGQMVAGIPGQQITMADLPPLP